MTWRDMLSEKDVENGKYWTEPWGLVEGCTPISEGCIHCWSAAIHHNFRTRYETQARIRVKESPLIDYKTRGWNGKIICHEDKLSLPARRGKGRVFSVWNDLGHDGVPEDFIRQALDVMGGNRRHRYLILTKRAERMQRLTSRFAAFGTGDYGDHIWFGTTAENQARLDERLPHLLKVPSNRFISFEPVLGRIDASLALGLEWSDMGEWLDNREWALSGLPRPIGWGVIGCETGPGRRPCKMEDIQYLVDQFAEAGVPCWVKAVDLGNRVSHKMSEWPESLQVRQLPGEHV